MTRLYLYTRRMALVQKTLVHQSHSITMYVATCIRSNSIYQSWIRTAHHKKLSTNKEPAVLFDRVGTAGVVTLNRPKQLNAMHNNVWKHLLPQLTAWENNKSRIIIKGAGNAFSAGADLKLLCLSDLETNKAYIGTSFQGLYLVSKYKIPYIALMDGVAFGSGLTLAVNGQYRVATERTLAAFPETRIGWLTDASATYLLPRMKNCLGYYLGLTGERLKGKDVVLSGLATHFVPSTRLKELEIELCHSQVEEIATILDTFNETYGKFSLDPVMNDIDYCFSAEIVEEIIERLLKVDNSWSNKTLQTLSQVCPTMLKVNLRALQYGKTRDIKECFKMEYRVLSRCVGSHNGLEGMRAVLDRSRKPKWRPAALSEVSDVMVDSYFAPMSEGEELTFFDD